MPIFYLVLSTGIHFFFKFADIWTNSKFGHTVQFVSAENEWTQVGYRANGPLVLLLREMCNFDNVGHCQTPSGILMWILSRSPKLFVLPLEIFVPCYFSNSLIL